MKKNLLILLLLFVTTYVFSQKYGDRQFYLIDSLVLEDLNPNDKEYIDSVLTEYHKAIDDTLKLDVLGLIIENVWDDNVWPKYNQYSLNYSTRLLKEKDWKTHTQLFLQRKQASALSNLGFEYDNMGDSKNAIKYYLQAVEIQKKINAFEDLGTSFGNIGYVYKTNGQTEKALEYYNKALAIQEKIKHKKGMAYTFNNIGMVFYAQGEKEAALEYYRKSLKVEQDLKDYYSVGNTLNNIAYIFEEKEQYDSVIFYYQQAIKMHERINYNLGLGMLNNNMGKTYLVLKEYDKASICLFKAVEHFEKENNHRIAGVYSNLANLFYRLNELDKAKKYGLEAYQISEKSNALQFLRDAVSILSLIYKKEGNYRKSLEMYEFSIKLKDSLSNEESQRAAIKQKVNYDYEKQALADSLIFAEKQKIEEIQHNQAMTKQRNYTYAGLIGFIFMLLIAVLIFRGYNQKKKTNLALAEKNSIITKQKQEVENQKHIVEEKNQEILDSITYAKRIQSAILPPSKVVKSYLKESFILYKPKDIVAGDFYWMEVVGNKVLFAAADCTGHGVPGAMVSVVCNNGLNRSVREYNLTDPGEILGKTREIVVQEFEKSEEEVKDGMDIALCCLEGNKLNYAGAHNPLWVIRNGAEEIEEIKANKQPIGQFDNPEPYDTHSIELNEGDTIYVFSDGYADQFGGEKGKKLKSANFKKLLLSIQAENMERQREMIDIEFENWKGELEQLDDVCVIGVRV